MVKATLDAARAGRAADPASPEAATAGTPLRIRCGFCGTVFDEDRAQPTCVACPLSTRVCRHIRCPHCGFENPATPAWIARAPGVLGRLKEWITS